VDVANAKPVAGEETRDGRLRRAERSRDAIVRALFELVGEGVLQPTAQQVAERAGVGIRTVFRHFDDMDGLFATMQARLRDQAMPILRESPSAGSLRERAKALVDRRVRLYEKIGPFKRSANVQRWRSKFLTSRHASLVRELRGALLRALPELADGTAERLEAVDALLSFETWDRMRTDQRLSRERTHATLERAVLALLDV
jgi:AcrR family transcriptional regulator